MHELDASTARIEVQTLLQHVLQVPRAYLLAHPEQVPEAKQQAAYDAILQRRLQGEPIAYLLGEREFFGLNLKVTPATLIPRPDTELLVELALQRVPQNKVCRVLDLGTGSGAIALAIAHSRPGAAVTAIDAAEAALQVARENARRLGIANVVFQRSDWFAALNGQRFDLIVSNPPYVATGDRHLVRGDVRFEPRSALVSGEDGLDDIRRIVSQTESYLEREAWLLLEHGYDQAARVRGIFQQYGFGEIFSAKDIAGIDRVSGGVKLR
ncbi:MAG: peptide chain release factor N(5)-glutamine methyltransferase [Nitrosomonadales bacterium]|nr:peptide chain release factor N(5)-glutamine methyltransferase [Nitrosomonadales bacterium]